MKLTQVNAVTLANGGLKFGIEGEVGSWEEFNALCALVGPTTTRRKGPKATAHATDFGNAEVKKTKHGFTAVGVDGAVAGLRAGGDSEEDALANLVALTAGEALKLAAPAKEEEEEPKAEKSKKPKANRPVRVKAAPPRKPRDEPAPAAGPDPAPTSATKRAPAQPSNTEASAPAVEVPPELATARSFRQVMKWMVGNGFTEAEEIVAKCEEMRPHVAAIGRVSNNLGERVQRALSVLELSAGAA